MLHYTEEQINAIIAELFKLYIKLLNSETKDSSNLATFMTEEGFPMACWFHKENSLQQGSIEDNQTLSTVLTNAIVNDTYKHKISISVIDLSDEHNAVMFQEPSFYKNEERTDIYQSFNVSVRDNSAVLIEVYTTKMFNV